MGLFGIFKKKEVDPIIIAADAKGTVLPMQDIPDPVFSDAVLGPCCAIDPIEGSVFAPVDGTISQVAETLHAIGIESNGVEILIHVGIETVSMNGDGFLSKVKEGDEVKQGQLILTMDLDKIKAAGHPAVVVTIVTNSDDFGNVELVASGGVEPGDALLKITK